MSIQLLKAMIAQPASKGWFQRFGKKSNHGSRHRKSQMKAMGKGRFTGKGARFGL